MDWYWYLLIGGFATFVVVWLLLDCRFPWNEKKFHCIVPMRGKVNLGELEVKLDVNKTKYNVTKGAKPVDVIDKNPEVLELLFTDEKKHDREKKELQYPHGDEKYENIEDILHFKF